MARDLRGEEATEPGKMQVSMALIHLDVPPHLQSDPKHWNFYDNKFF